MDIVVVTLIMFGAGLILGIPAAFLKRRSVTFYKVYSGICLSIIAIILAFRHTLLVFPIDLYSPVADDRWRLIEFLAIALGGFYMLFVLGYGFSLWLSSKFFIKK